MGERGARTRDGFWVAVCGPCDVVWPWPHGTLVPYGWALCGIGLAVTTRVDGAGGQYRDIL